MPATTSAKASLMSWCRALKRLMIDTMARENDFAALRAIDMIARLRGLVPTTAKCSDGITAALEEMRATQQTSRGRGSRTRMPPASPATPDIVFDPPMPPELRPPVEPAPASAPKHHRPHQTRCAPAAIEAARAAARRRLFRYEHLMARHPELSAKIRDLSDAQVYFDEGDNLLPPELWPDNTHPTNTRPPSRDTSGMITFDNSYVLVWG